MRILVTGGTGLLGRPLVRALVARGHAVIGLARSEAAAATLAADGAMAGRGDLADPPSLDAHVQGAEAIVHLAGGPRGAGAIDAATLNLRYTEALLARLGGRRPRILFASSAAVYGDRSGLWVDEDMRPLPHTAYGMAKVAAEARLSGAVILRLAAVYGPGAPFLQVARIQAGAAWLPGEGRNFVPTLHVDDAVAGLCLALERGEPGRVYNLADRRPVPLRELYAAVHAAVGGRPVRFWSTWIPSALQHRAAQANEALWSALGQRPRFTRDALKLFTASVRLHTTRAEKELGLQWAHPDPIAGVAAALAAPGATP